MEKEVGGENESTPLSGDSNQQQNNKRKSTVSSVSSIPSGISASSEREVRKSQCLHSKERETMATTVTERVAQWRIQNLEQKGIKRKRGYQRGRRSKSREIIAIEEK